MADCADVAGDLIDREMAALVAGVTKRPRQRGCGVCFYCGRDIPVSRLAAEPGAERCLPCQTMVEAGCKF